jgi:hypothetical protein
VYIELSNISAEEEAISNLSQKYQQNIFNYLLKLYKAVAIMATT